MKLVLEANEGLVGGRRELDVAEDRGGSIGADLRGVLCDGEGLQLVLGDIGQLPAWRRVFASEDVQVHRNAWRRFEFSVLGTILTGPPYLRNTACRTGWQGFRWLVRGLGPWVVRGHFRCPRRVRDRNRSKVVGSSPR